MTFPASAPARKLARAPLLLLFLWTGFVAYTQGPSAPPPAKPEPVPSKRVDPADPSKTDPDDTPILQFTIRTAFSLTPAMVRNLQPKSADGAAAQKNAGQPSDNASEIAWAGTLTRTLPFTAPLDVRLAGKTVVALIRIIPVELRATLLQLIVQGQVWVKMPDDSLSFKTMVQSLGVALGSKFYFYPLGVEAKTGAPIVVEIGVDRQGKQ